MSAAFSSLEAPAVPEAALELSQVPQTGDLARVLAFVRASGDSGPTPSEAGFEGREALACAHAGRLLGLLDASGAQTSAGRELAPHAAARPAPDSVREALLAQPFASLNPPTRLENWATRMKLVTVRDVVAFGRHALLAQRNLGRTSVAQLDRILVTAGQGGLDALHAFVVDAQRSGEEAEVEGAEQAPTREPTQWSALAAWLPELVASQPVLRARLPTRLANHCERSGIETVGALASLNAYDLMAAKNIGRRSLKDGLAAIIALAKQLGAAPSAPGEAPEPSFRLDAFESYEGAFRAMLATLPFTTRLVLSRRAGVAAAPSTLKEIGELIGVTRERARQLESAALVRLRDELPALALAARLDEALGGQARSVEVLAEDSFWASAVEAPARLRYLVERVIQGERCVVPWGDESWVVCPSLISEADGAFGAFEAKLEARFPLPLEELEAAAHAAGEALHPGFGSLFVERLEGELLLDASGAIAVGYGSARKDRIRAFLISSRCPVAASIVVDRFGRGRLPEDVVYVERGLVTMPENIEGFALWSERLVPLCLGLMEEHGPELQWMTADLLELLHERAQVPAFVTPHVLAGMLRNSKAFDDLGRMRFALPGSASEGRIQFVPALVRILADAGRPVDSSRVGALVDVSERGPNRLQLRLHDSVLGPAHVCLQRDKGVQLKNADPVFAVQCPPYALVNVDTEALTAAKGVGSRSLAGGVAVVVAFAQRLGAPGAGPPPAFCLDAFESYEAALHATFDTLPFKVSMTATLGSSSAMSLTAARSSSASRPCRGERRRGELARFAIRQSIP